MVGAICTNRCLRFGFSSGFLLSVSEVPPVAKQKHFLVSRVIEPEQLTDPIERVEIEAVFSKTVQEIAWRDLQDESVWRQGWV
jgi:tryptophan-rich hypothetical protein